MIADSNRSSAETILEVEGLGVVFGQHAVLRDVNLGVRRGETLAIIGESGCGKTVLLKNMIALIRPTSGRVLFDGRDLNRLNERELARQRTRYGFVFQQAALFDSMTVGDNIAFPLRQHTRMTEKTIWRIVQDRLAEVGLPEHVANKKPAELSGGMRKRVGLARALAMEPEVLLYDEPTTGLDPIMSDVINELILSTRSRHEVTGILVTHDIKSARKVANRIVMLFPLSRLRRGDTQILFDGTPEALDASPDSRVTQFIEGHAGDRIMEMRQGR